MPDDSGSGFTRHVTKLSYAPTRKTIIMRKAIGFVIALFALSHFFSATFSQLDDTATSTLKAIDVAADVSREKMTELK